MAIRYITNVIQRNWRGNLFGKVHAYMGDSAKVPSNLKAMCGFANGERTSFVATRMYVTCVSCSRTIDKEFSERPMSKTEQSAHESRMLVAPWGTFAGEPVHTNSIEEEALGLLEVISGWRRDGYYVRVDRTLEQANTVIESIDWERVARVKVDFDIRMSGSIVVSDVPVYFITEKRYQRLLRFCRKIVPIELFESEMRFAVKQCIDNGQRRTVVSGLQGDSH